MEIKDEDWLKIREFFDRSWVRPGNRGAEYCLFCQEGVYYPQSNNGRPFAEHRLNCLYLLVSQVESEPVADGAVDAEIDKPRKGGGMT